MGEVTEKNDGPRKCGVIMSDGEPCQRPMICPYHNLDRWKMDICGQEKIRGGICTRRGGCPYHRPNDRRRKQMLSKTEPPSQVLPLGFPMGFPQAPLMPQAALFRGFGPGIPPGVTLPQLGPQPMIMMPGSVVSPELMRYMAFHSAQLPVAPQEALPPGAAAAADSRPKEAALPPFTMPAGTEAIAAATQPQLTQEADPPLTTVAFESAQLGGGSAPASLDSDADLELMRSILPSFYHPGASHAHLPPPSPCNLCVSKNPVSLDEIMARRRAVERETGLSVRIN